MATKSQILKSKFVLPMSEESRARIAVVANEIKDKELFPEKVARAKKLMKKVKNLPI